MYFKCTIGFYAIHGVLCHKVVTKAFQDFNNIINLPMFIDPQTTFMMSSLCHVIHLGYLLRNVFLSLGILQHYAKFELNTMTTLKILFDK
jgi:hypothetical protein